MMYTTSRSLLVAVLAAVTALVAGNAALHAPAGWPVSWDTALPWLGLLAFVIFAPGRGISLPIVVGVLFFLAIWRPQARLVAPVVSSARTSLLVELLFTFLVLLLIRELSKLAKWLQYKAGQEGEGGEPTPGPGGKEPRPREREPREPRPRSDWWEPQPHRAMPKMLSTILMLLQEPTFPRERRYGSLLLLLLGLTAFSSRPTNPQWDSMALFFWIGSAAMWVILISFMLHTLARRSPGRRS
jgi:hypothetical protein